MRLLLYSPDSYGLGHVRRSILVARALLREYPRATARVVTGAPRAHYFRYPPGLDFVKIPSITKDRRGGYVPVDLDHTLAETVAARSSMIDAAYSAFRPELLYVDHVPTGLGRELLPTLDRLREDPHRPLRILGMRDVIDEPARVRETWHREGIVDVLRDHYDLIVIFGQRDVFDPVSAYAIPRDVAEKTIFAGYIPRAGTAAPPDATAVRSRYAPRTGKLVVVTLGGGGDGNLLLRAFLKGYARCDPAPPFEVLAVTGPLMSPRKRRRLKERADRIDGVRLVEYVDALPGLMGAADFTVSMAGYNTVAELASLGARALLVPRVFPRREQLLRSRLLAARGVVRYLEPDEVRPDRLIEEVVRGLGHPYPEPGWGLEATGLTRLARAVRERLSSPRASRARSCKTSSRERPSNP